MAKKSWWTKGPSKKPTAKPTPKVEYRQRFVVEEMRAHKIKVLRDKETARNFVSQRKYSKPGIYKIRVEKIKRGW